MTLLVIKLLKLIFFSEVHFLNIPTILVTELVSKLDELSPLKTLSRGYTLTQKENKIIKSAKDVKTGDEVSIKFIDGTKSAKIL